MDESENLSIKLFNPRGFSKETSAIFGSLAKGSDDIDYILDGETASNWYRVLRRPQWSWLGIDPILIEETLSRIAMSSHERSHEDKLDTVIGYRKGNWAYEWAQNGADAERIAKEHYQNAQPKLAAHQWLLASHCYSLAAYPYLKGDNLAVQAEMLANKTFNEAIKHLPYKVKTVTTQVEGKTLEGFLYLPHTDSPLATVIVSVGFESLQTDLWNLFEKYFLPANIAMLTIDMPGIGRSSQWPLTEDTSYLHQAMLNELKNVPWVDHHRVGCLGMRLGGNAAVRLAFLEPTRLKSCVSVGGILHAFFVSDKKQNKLPAMQLDTLASSMDKNVSSSLVTQLQTFSLKKQGLLAGRQTPVALLAIGLSNDPLGSDADNQLAARFSREGIAKKLPSSPLHDAYHRIMLEMITWFTNTL